MGDAAALPGRLLAGVSSPCSNIPLAAMGSIRGTNGLENLRDVGCAGTNSLLGAGICSELSVVAVVDTSNR